MEYFGDFAEDATVRIPFNTFTSDDPQASATITNLVDADIKVHKDGGLTQIATDGATVSIDYDGITGNHLITVDTSVHADYATGSEYQVRIEGTTVDAGTINAWVGCFSIERSGGVLALLKAGLTVDLNADQSGVTIGTVNNVTGLVAGTGGISVAAENFVPTTGTETNTYTSTRAEDGVFHTLTPATGTTDGYYVFNVGNSGLPQSVTWIGYAQSQGDEYALYAYNWGTTTFEQVKSISASNGTTQITSTPELLTDHVGTGTNSGEVRLRVYSTTGTSFATDRIYCTYTQATSGIPNGSTLTLDSSSTNQNFIGHNWKLILAGHIISGAYIFQATSISGTGIITNGNFTTIQESNIATATLSAYFFAETSNLSDVLTITSTAGVDPDIIDLVNCNSGVEGDNSPEIDVSGVTKATGIQNRKWGGGCTYSINSFCTLSHETVVGGTVTITNASGTAEIRGSVNALVVTSTGTAVTTFVCTSGAPITVNGTGGTLNVYGVHGGITDNSGASVTINDLGDDITNKTGRSLLTTEHTAIVDEWKTQSQADPTGFHVNLLEIDGNHSLVLRLKEFIDANVLYSDSAVAGTSTTITLAPGTSLRDNDLRDYACYLHSGTGAGQFGRIESVIAATQVATIVTAANGWQTAPDATSGYVILTMGADIHISHIHPVALTEITTELDTNSTFASEVTQVLADTNELQTDDIPGLIAALNNIAATDIVSGGAITTSSGQASSDVTAINGSTSSAQNLAASTLGIVAGTATAGTLSSTQMSTNLTEATANHYASGLLVWTSGVLANQRTPITGYTPTGGILTFDETYTAESPSAGDTFVIV